MHRLKQTIRPILIALVLMVAPFLQVSLTDAAQITSRSIALSNSVGAASGVTYTLSTAALPTTTAVQSVDVSFCATPVSGTCVGQAAPSGFSASSSTLASQPTGLGAASGWTVNAATAGSLRIVDASNATTSSGAVSIVWNAVHNPTATNTTFYATITTYTGSNWSTGPLDTGNVALSTSAQIQVSLLVGEALTFCTGTTITGQNCGTISGTTVNLGSGSVAATSSGTSVFAASTNGAGGYTVTVNGTTLTSGAQTITALASNAASAIGTKQFGINLMSNATPSVGAGVSGTGSAVAAANYNTADSFRFATGETVASASVPTNANAFTVSYIANISGVTQPGNYQTNLNYVATANF